jgi:hypothetical protein
VSTNLGPQLPPSVNAFLSGNDLAAHLGTAMIFTTTGDDGYPHPCVVTAGEVYAASPTRLHLALYPTSSATRNLRARHVGTLALATAGAAYYVKADAEEVSSPPDLEDQAVFVLTPRHVLEDREPGAEVTSSFRYTDARGEQAVLAGWQRVVNALRTLAESQP